MCKRVLRVSRRHATWRDGQRDAVLPAGCLPAAGRGAHGRAGETPRAGRRGCHGGDRARYPCVPPGPPPPASLGMGRSHCHVSSRLQVLPGIVPAQPAAATDLRRAGAAGTGTHPSPGCRHPWHAGGVSPLPARPHRVGPAIPVLQRHGLRVLPRDPYSFTPLLEDRSPPRSLLLGHDTAQTQRQIAQFSRKDAEVLWGHVSGMAKPPRGCPAQWSGRDAPR